MKRKYNWGILGPGNIARSFSEGLKLLNNANLYSVGSRSSERAAAFAMEHGYKKHYGSYEEFVRDPGLDIVYIATPHSFHLEHTILCLKNGKAVVCEKAFAHNIKEVEEMIDLSVKEKLFLMEALWPPFQPSYIKAKEIIGSGRFGRILHINSQFAFKGPYDLKSRLYNLDLAGGSLLDIGIYPVIDALTFLGIPDMIKTNAVLAPTGADESISILFGYNNGTAATLFSSFTNNGGVRTEILCEEGKISLRRGKDKSQRILIEDSEGKSEELVFTPDARGFQYEAIEIMRCMDEGLLQSPVVPHDFSRALIKTLDRIRKDAGIIYPCEKYG